MEVTGDEQIVKKMYYESKKGMEELERINKGRIQVNVRLE